MCVLTKLNINFKNVTIDSILYTPHLPPPLPAPATCTPRKLHWWGLTSSRDSRVTLRQLPLLEQCPSFYLKSVGSIDSTSLWRQTGELIYSSGTQFPYLQNENEKEPPSKVCFGGEVRWCRQSTCVSVCEVLCTESSRSHSWWRRQLSEVPGGG